MRGRHRQSEDRAGADQCSRRGVGEEALAMVHRRHSLSQHNSHTPTANEAADHHSKRHDTEERLDSLHRARQ